ncbi:MAG: glycoside hydrolase family 127 protein, partial [Treponema sp.]|nr:glycoside hydrolase family 127 protein [Treponema sp.]
LYAGVADLYAETGDATLLPALESPLEDEISSKVYINGGIGALYDGVSPSGYAGDFPALQRTHQAFGRPYELPNITAYNETCASVGNILWNWRMFLINPNARHIDLIEHSFYNLILASVSLDGEKYFYTNMLRREKDRLPYFLKWSETREPWLSSFCCPPNMMRILAESSAFTYGVNQDSIYTGLYGESCAEIDLGGGNFVRLSQKTAYPWDGKILIRFDNVRALRCTFQIRVPFWAGGGFILDPEGNRRTLGPSDAGTFIPLERTWNSGDELRIDLPVEPALYLAHPLIEETNHHAAVMRGPLLYCMEGCDNMSRDYSTLGVRRNAVFREQTMNIAGTDLIILETEDGASYSPPDWRNGKLYQKAGPCPAAKEKLRLIPYFAWDNRGLAAMKVWLPLYL